MKRQNSTLRGLMYFAELYQIHLTKLHKDIYSTSLVKLPTPKFIVFYNGIDKADVPDEMKLRLSDAFIKEDKSGDFEWTATMYNINANHNGVLLQKCQALGAYSTYISRIHSNMANGMSKNDAVQEAVDFAVKENLLDGYFAQKKMEVLNMSLHEFDKDEYDRNRREEGMAQKAASTARAMLADSLPIATIVRYTGLTQDEVLALQ